MLAYGLGPVELVDEKFDYDQAHPAAGVWLGNVSGPKESWSIGQLVIQRDEGWAVTAFIPSLDAYHAAGAEVAVEAGSITFNLGSEGEPWRIHASVSDDGQRMIGTISTEHGEAAGTLELARTLRPADLPDPTRFAGEISTPNTGALEISITLARTPGGHWVGALDFPAGGLTGLPLYNISGGDDGLRAEVPLRRGGVIEATFDQNHERLTGILKQGFFEFALELTRGAADTPRPRADPASAFGRWAEASWMIRRHVGPRWVLAGGNVIDVRTGQVQMGANIVISGDIIESVSDEPVADDMHVVDITGRYVIPGLFDLHAHVQPFDRGATPESSETTEIFETLLDHGVTVVRALPLYSEFALALAAHGYTMTGLDIAEEFIDEARSAAGSRALDIRWICGDMRRLPEETAFDGAFCWGNSFGYLDDAGNAEFLDAVGGGLGPGARFVIDYGAIAEALLPNFQEHRSFEVGGITMKI
ncbi:MAG: methyltransferase domain-containing protein, partial [Planctomycetes bacterium]|nr:methyltransferase domain-containing protein [Planctomycetota bacterium]